MQILSEHFTYKKLIRFTLPTIIMTLLTSIYGVVDGLFISNFVGSDAFASVNLIIPALMILGAIGFMVGTGGSALISKTLGEGNREKANQYFSMLVYILIIIGIVLTVIGMLAIEHIAVFLGANEDMLEDCVIYGRVSLVTLIAFLLQNSFQSFLITAGKPKMGLKISIMAGLANIIFDAIFIVVLKMGVFGAALATTISQSIGGIIPLVYFNSKNDSLLRIVSAKLDLKAILQACINGSSEMLTNASISLVNILFNMQLMNMIGAKGVVAYGIVMYISLVFSGVYMGYSIGSGPIIAYNYGADNKKELKSLLKKSIKLFMLSSVTMTVLVEILAKPLASIFVSYDKDLLELTVTAIRIYSISYLMSGFNIFASSFFTALNNEFVSAMISFLRIIVFQIFMVTFLPILLGINGIWISIAVAEFLALLVSIIFLIENRKKYGYI